MKTLNRCRNNMEADNVVLIDVDSYNFSNVIVIDVPENHTKKLGGSNGLRNEKTRPLRTYIYIDDDESPDNHHAGAHVDSDINFDNGASSSRRYDPDTPYAQESISPVKLSKGKRTYSGRGSNNCKGFSRQSDSDSSDDDDSPDCEFMEDSSGKLREQWERASMKRKADVRNDLCGRRDCSSASRPFWGAPNDFGVEKNKQKNSEVSNSEGTNHEKEHQSPVTAVETDDCNQLDSGHRDEKYDQTPSTSSQEENGKNDLLDALTIDAAPVESSIIDQREKLKETDEYKRALEEELSARQIALKIQAEEAQRLRRLHKRRKAESLRLLDMERRQKQRVEEIRETQKKDEENMNLKELYRTEVRKELSKLETTCLDMASLLLGLGIPVGDGPHPLPHEVRAAYKRALLSFHPDRASGSDMRQQVEAEEKFKLVSRMKEKLLP